MSSSSLKRPASEMESDKELRWGLARLLGVKVSTIGSLRKTVDQKVSVIDVTAAVTGRGKHGSAEAVRTICQNFPEVGGKIGHLSFPGPGQRETPIADLATMIEIIMLLPGTVAAKVRVEASKLLVRYLGGDLKLVDEVQNLRHIQEELADSMPLHSLRTFGKAVEASGGGGSSSSLSELRKEFALALEATKAAFEESLAKVRVEVLEAVSEVKEVARATTRIEFTRGVNPKSSAELLALGNVLEGDEGKRIIREEKMLSVSDFRKQNLPPNKKLRLCVFSRKLKAAKLQQCREHGTKPYLQNTQGEYRIAYMEADRELMQTVLAEMIGPVPEVAEVPEVLHA